MSKRKPPPLDDFARLVDEAMLALADGKVDDAKKRLSALAILIAKESAGWRRPSRGSAREAWRAMTVRVLHEHLDWKLEAAVSAMVEDIEDPEERAKARMRIEKTSRQFKNISRRSPFSRAVAQRFSPRNRK